ncbi:uncharacterized protein LOC131609654 isoform X3 [Vicia villosa]|uniref:uncharacterized protein LOC131609654 isoform X3 n=1 Tax=Vicia villosa TaxID=3911 RepID=UPI00273C6988|nr:uncharacterized protein LOC131609654 isoform X3 [Vicia villosa]
MAISILPLVMITLQALIRYLPHVTFFVKGEARSKFYVWVMMFGEIFKLSLLSPCTIVKLVCLSKALLTETYNQYSLPPEFDQVPPRAPIIAVLGDCLSFSYFSYETELIIWQMKKFGVEDSWSQFLKISCHSLQIHYDYSEYMLFFFELVPLFLSKDGDTLILKCFQEDQEILYNRRNNTVVRTKITATTTTTDDRTVHSISCTANDHIESLVSVFLKS